MKKLLILPVALLILASCGGNKKQEDEKPNVQEFADIAKDVKATAPDGHTAQNSLDTDGLYIGFIADAAGKVSTDTTKIKLEGKKFTKTVKPAGTKPATIVDGMVAWSEDGTSISLLGAGEPNKYFVGENQLMLLDKDGKRVTGDNASKYTLIKK